MAASSSRSSCLCSTHSSAKDLPPGLRLSRPKPRRMVAAVTVSVFFPLRMAESYHGLKVCQEAFSRNFVERWIRLKGWGDLAAKERKEHRDRGQTAENRPSLVFSRALLWQMLLIPR